MLCQWLKTMAVDPGCRNVNIVPVPPHGVMSIEVLDMYWSCMCHQQFSNSVAWGQSCQWPFGCCSHEYELSPCMGCSNNMWRLSDSGSDAMCTQHCVRLSCGVACNICSLLRFVPYGPCCLSALLSLATKEVISAVCTHHTASWLLSESCWHATVHTDDQVLRWKLHQAVCLWLYTLIVSSYAKHKHHSRAVFLCTATKFALRRIHTWASVTHIYYTSAAHWKCNLSYKLMSNFC